MRHSELTAIHGCDVKVSKLSLGTAPLGGLFMKVAESESDAVIREALPSSSNIARSFSECQLRTFIWI